MHNEADEEISVPGVGIIKAFLEQATTKGTKSTILRPIGWMMVILVSATFSSFYFKTPLWVGVIFTIFSSLTMLLYLVTYIYCLFTDKDALRSETYSIQKLAIEKGFVGDNLVGQLKPTKPIIGLIKPGTSDESEAKS